jgi:glycosyltransferase involved in cell wall biosynthesis
MSGTPHISVVVPVYRCRDCLWELHRRLVDAVAELPGDAEFVLVEDRGPDGAWEEIEALAASDPRVRGFRLSRNFGQQAAISAGLAQARGDWVVVMDCDLQDPPEEIVRLYAKAIEGFDVVLARRTRRSDRFARRVLSRLYFRILGIFTGTRIDGEFGSFSIISRKVVEAFLRLQERDRHYLFVLSWLGFDRSSIDYEQDARFAGSSSYGFARLLRHAIQGMFFQTTVLLRWIIYFGFAVALSGVGATIYLVIKRVSGSAYPGWTSLFVLILLMGGFIIISTGITGLYIGRIFEEARSRPLYVIDRATDAEPARSEAVESSATHERVG